MNNTISNLQDSHNSKVLQLDQQHEVPKFQNNLVYYAIHEKIVKIFFIDMQNVKYILSDTYFCPNCIKIEN